jgi:hypothetical protein
VAGPPPGTDAVNCWDCDSVSAALRGATLKLFGSVMLTVTEAAKLPPPPVQVRVNVVAALSAPVTALPLGGSFPLQPPEAAHAVALVELQWSVVAAPLTTEAGLAVSAVVGGVGATAVTVTVEVAGVLPAPPAHVSVKLVVAFSGPVLALPLGGSFPLQPPEAVHAVAFVELQLSVAVPPVLTLIVLAFSATLGGGSVGGGSVCAGDEDDPPEPQPLRIAANASAAPQIRWLRAAGWLASRCARKIPRRAELFFFVILRCPWWRARSTSATDSGWSPRRLRLRIRGRAFA